MHSGNNELVKAGHDFAAAISNDTPIIEIAKIVSRLAAQLGVTTLALREKSHELTAYEATVTNLTAQVQGLAAENAALREWSPSPHSTAMFEAIEKAEQLMDDGMPELAMIEAFEILKLKRTPRTDAALAEIRNEARAEGADLCVKALVTSGDDTFEDAPNICAMVAFQLRKEQGK
ncbi:hypothetical protein KC222_10960 [Cedecea davisae]|uniref:Uncharacterized protein n=1 Tax=Cedecea davisae TaxID=158484 RepID=A0ABS6DH60_9ENTR|nr:hypothetical protein [Cedecea davisae]MBU4682534.1 hypothetical protein [Cedecea davisae]MBU4687636.1 hypothetical protein [Cedecea davisae]